MHGTMSSGPSGGMVLSWLLPFTDTYTIPILLFKFHWLKTITTSAILPKLIL